MRTWKKVRSFWVVGLAVVVAAAVTASAVMAGTNPPPTYSGGYTPVVYSSTTGAVRLVKPWGVARASVPNCTPPSPWATNPPYDPTPCNTGGSFDAKSGEFYTELPAGFSSDLNKAYLNVAYNSSTGNARVVPPWGVTGGSIPNCTPPSPWQIAGVTYNPTPCNTGGSFATKKSDFYTELQGGGGTMSVGLGDSGNSTNPPAAFIGFVPIAFNSSTGAMRFVRPWGVAGASIPNCTPPSPWAINPPYDPTPCNIGGAFDAQTSEMYTELSLF